MIAELLVTEKIAAALADHKIPWRNDFGSPKNIANDCLYQGVNALLLNIATEQLALTTCYWGTWSQWRAQGLTIKKDQPGTKIVQKNKDHFTFWTVYNRDQVEGGSIKPTTPVDYQKVNQLIVDTKANICFKFGAEAIYFFPPLDFIKFPLKEQFETGPGGLPGYYNSLFHEISHWTEPRVKWTGSEAVRELRAEITADFLTTELNIPRLGYATRINHHFFLEQWLTMMCQDTTLIFQIAEDASKAMNYITGDNYNK